MLSTPGKRFTTFQVARICGVFHTTVINWANKGKLKAHHTPGGHRRIDLEDLLDFMRRYDMPIPPDLIAQDHKILVVEDDPAAQRVLVRAVQSVPNSEVTACSGGIEALINIGKDAPELLILDIHIPQVNGIEVVKILRAGPPTNLIKIVAVSGGTVSRAEESFLKAHADAYVRKPLSAREFRQQVLELLDLEAEAAEAVR